MAWELAEFAGDCVIPLSGGGAASWEIATPHSTNPAKKVRKHLMMRLLPDFTNSTKDTQPRNLNLRCRFGPSWPHGSDPLRQNSISPYFSRISARTVPASRPRNRLIRRSEKTLADTSYSLCAFEFDSCETLTGLFQETEIQEFQLGHLIRFPKWAVGR